MKSINLIIPYFGEFPNYFPLFLKSCEFNKTIDWTIITDNRVNYEYPTNVHKIDMSFRELKIRIQSKVQFSISLEEPYKLCDFRPAYGFLFPEIVDGYDYWGYCDVDVIFGDIRKFLTDDLLKYPKLFELGHFTLIKNNIFYNEMFMRHINNQLYYKKVFTNRKSYNFDETFLDRININMIFEQNNVFVLKERFMADIYTKSSDFKIDYGNKGIESRKRGFFLWKEGVLKRYVKDQDHMIGIEYMYIHLQKRKMSVHVNYKCTDCFKIIPNSFDYLEISPEDIELYFGKVKKKHVNLHYFRLRMNNLGKKIKERVKK